MVSQRLATYPSQACMSELASHSTLKQALAILKTDGLAGSSTEWHACHLQQDCGETWVKACHEDRNSGDIRQDHRCNRILRFVNRASERAMRLHPQMNHMNLRVYFLGIIFLPPITSTDFRANHKQASEWPKQLHSTRVRGNIKRARDRHGLRCLRLPAPQFNYLLFDFGGVCRSGTRRSWALDPSV